MPSMMKERWGRIVNIASVVGQMGNAGQANYVSSKAGLIGLTKAVAREIAARNITVNAVAPGFIETDMTSDLGEDVKGTAVAGIAVGRFGTSQEIASTVGYLASDAASYVHGSCFAVDGGLTAI